MTCVPLLLGQMDQLVRSPLCWGIVLGATSLWLLLSGGSETLRGIGKLLGAISLLMLTATLMIVGDWSSQLVFWVLALITTGGAAAAITARSPVYTAIWFAVSLLGTAGLFLFQGAQFLGVATVVVYAGAIVVTFLFVLMLAQPEGHAPYDRISWSTFAVPTALVGAAAVIALVLTSLDGLRSSEPLTSPPQIATSQQHMAELGGHLFAYHLVSIEVIGTLLMVALVGAIAIVLHGRKSRPETAPDHPSRPTTDAGLPGGTP